MGHRDPPDPRPQLRRLPRMVIHRDAVRVVDPQQIRMPQRPRIGLHPIIDLPASSSTKYTCDSVPATVTSPAADTPTAKAVTASAVAACAWAACVNRLVPADQPPASTTVSTYVPVHACSAPASMR